MKQHITSLLSQQFGKFASKEFSPWFQNIVNNGYVKIMGLDMSEFHDPSTYKTLNQLFTRKMREQRHFSIDADDFISPCDSLITQFGDLDELISLSKELDIIDNYMYYYQEENHFCSTTDKLNIVIRCEKSCEY